MHCHRFALLSSLLVGGLALPAASARADATPFIFSPAGPGVGHGALGLGGKLHMVVPELYVPIPTFDLHYVHGITENFDLRLSLDTLLVANVIDAGLRVKFGGPQFSFAVTGGVTALVLVVGGSDGGGASAAVAATPGAFIGFGSPSVQVTVGADVPMFFAVGAISTIGGSSNGGGLTGFAATIRPSAAIEFPVSRTTNLYLQGSVLIIPDVDFVIGPMLSIGAGF